MLAITRQARTAPGDRAVEVPDNDRAFAESFDIGPAVSQTLLSVQIWLNQFYNVRIRKTAYVNVMGGFGESAEYVNGMQVYGHLIND